MDEMKTAKHNKKIMLLVTDGFDTKSHITSMQVEDILKRSEVLVYAIGIDGQSEMTGNRPPIIQPRGPIQGPFPFPIPGRGRP